MKLIDTHAHLDQMKSLDDAISRAKSIGIIAIVAVGMNQKSNQKILQISESYGGFVFAALGMHPFSIDSDLKKSLDFIRNNIKNSVAVGEIGLDYLLSADRAFQKKVFKELLKIALEYEKPVIIHTRGEGSHSDALAILRDLGVKRGVFHWYSGPLDTLRGILDRGYFVSATPSIVEREEHRSAIKIVSLDRLMLETDSPAKGYEPADLVKALSYVSKLKGTTEEKLAEYTTNNALKFFEIGI
ncbi:MAG: TatD family hydrolase [Halobacteriota archaeon]|nr:TatD family hydrolase [Halobacteriota archaeon]